MQERDINGGNSDEIEHSSDMNDENNLSNENEQNEEEGNDKKNTAAHVEKDSSGEFELVVLMTHDTDLQPALRMANLSSGVRIETAGWTGLNKLRLKEQKLFHTYLTVGDFKNSIDQKDYSRKGVKN